MDDLSNLTAALADDLDANFPEMVRVMQDRVFSGALRMLGDRQEAEDATQEAFLRAYRALGGYDPDRIRSLRLSGWVWTIAANLCRNRYRSRARRPVTPGLDMDPPDRGVGPEASALNRDLGDRLVAGLLDLSWPMRSAVVLHHIVGLTQQEISTALERPIGTVKADIHRGLARLRETLQEVTP